MNIVSGECIVTARREVPVPTLNANFVEQCVQLNNEAAIIARASGFKPSLVVNNT